MPEQATRISRVREYIALHETAISVFAILLTNLFVLGRFTFYLGLYYDEYVSFYILERFGFPKLFEFVGGQSRQLMTFVTLITAPNFVIGHALELIFSTACALLLLYLIRRVVPTISHFGTLFALLYLVYPVYFARVYTIAVPIEISLFAQLASLSLCYLALSRPSKPNWLYILLSLSLIPIFVNLYEMVIVMEVFRPVIIYAALRHRENGKVLPRYPLLAWVALWALVAGAAIFYRLFIFQPYGFYAKIGYNTGLATPDSANHFANVLYGGLVGLRAPLIEVWKNVVQNISVALSPYSLLVAVLVGIVGFALFYTSAKPKHRPARKAQSTYAILLTLSGLILATLSNFVILLVGRQLASDAYFYSHLSHIYIMNNLGMALLFTGLLWALYTAFSSNAARLISALLATLLVMGGGITHIYWNTFHVNQWDKERNFMWQMAELAPNWRDGTTLIVDHNYTIVSYPYIDFIIGDLFYDNPTISLIHASNATPDDKPSYDFDSGNWGFSWQSDYQQAVLFYADEQGCLHMIDPAQPLDARLKLSENALALLPYLPANPAQFILDTPIQDTALRERYLPRPNQPVCGIDFSAG